MVLTEQFHTEKCRLGMTADPLGDGSRMGTSTCRPGVLRDRAQVTEPPMAIDSSESGQLKKCRHGGGKKWVWGQFRQLFRSSI